MSGLEPPTPTLSGWCSNLLSYIPLFVVNTKVFMLGGGCPPYVLRLRYERFAQGGAQSAEHNEQNLFAISSTMDLRESGAPIPLFKTLCYNNKIKLMCQ